MVGDEVILGLLADSLRRESANAPRFHQRKKLSKKKTKQRERLRSAATREERGGGTTFNRTTINIIRLTDSRIGSDNSGGEDIHRMLRGKKGRVNANKHFFQKRALPKKWEERKLKQDAAARESGAPSAYGPTYNNTFNNITNHYHNGGSSEGSGSDEGNSIYL